MKKRFYEEPEIEMKAFSLTNIITSSPGGGLDIEDVIPPDEGGDNGGGDGFQGGDIF